MISLAIVYLKCISSAFVSTGGFASNKKWPLKRARDCELILGSAAKGASSLMYLALALRGLLELICSPASGNKGRCLVLFLGLRKETGLQSPRSSWLHCSLWQVGGRLGSATASLPAAKTSC